MIATELTDIVFHKGKQGGISLASLGLHVENQGVNSMFALPSYSNVNSVDWQEFDGEDVSFADASVNSLPLQIKVFGISSVIEKLVNDLRNLTTDNDIIVEFKISEGTFKNSVNFSTKFTGATLGKMVVINDWELQHFYLTDEDSDYIVTEAEALIMAGVEVKVLRRIAYATLTFTRYSNDADFGILADNLRGSQGIPQNRFTYAKFPSTNMPIELRRYRLNGKTAEQVDYFDFKNNLVFCYPLKGIVQGLKGFAESKTPYRVQTENMVGEVLETKMADKRRSKTVTLPLLIRSHSVTAIFRYLYEYKIFVHETLKGGDILYLHSESEGDFAIYPSGCNVKKAYIRDQPWVEIDLQFTCYKENFDFTALTDDVPEDNPEPPLPPAPAPTFDPYQGIDKTKWTALDFSNGTDRYAMNYPMLVSSSAQKGIQPPYNGYAYNTQAKFGWNDYAKYIKRYPVGTLFFATRNVQTINGKGSPVYNTLICLPWNVDKLAVALERFKEIAEEKGWEKKILTLVGVVQGCDVMSGNIAEWDSELQENGGLVGFGTAMVQTEVWNMRKDDFYIADGFHISHCDDFDLLVSNTIANYEEDPHVYYTQQGYENSKKH